MVVTSFAATLMTLLFSSSCVGSCPDERSLMWLVYVSLGLNLLGVVQLSRAKARFVAVGVLLAPVLIAVVVVGAAGAD